MARPRKPEDERKITITFRMTKKLVDIIKSQQNYNQKVEEVLEEKFGKK